MCLILGTSKISRGDRIKINIDNKKSVVERNPHKEPVEP